MSSAPAKLVSFAAPPVAEVVTSVRFAPMGIQDFLAIEGLRAASWSDAFPRVEQQAPYEVPAESFGGLQPPRFEFGFQTSPPLPRLWFISADGHELLQLQTDWFAANWRRQAVPKLRREGDVKYDRWEQRRSAFAQHWATLSRWIEDRGGHPTPNQYEVTYINHIVPIPGLWTAHGEVGMVLPSVAGFEPVGAGLEQVTARLQAVVPAEGVLPEARLHVTAMPAFAAPNPSEPTPEPLPIVVLELTVRGAPPDSNDLLPALDRARKVIVDNFVQITSVKARESWGQG